MKKISALILATCLTSSASALTLEEALTSSYDNNEELQISRKDFLETIEKFPQALSEFMPKVSASTTISHINSDRKSSLPTTVGGDSITFDTNRTTHDITVNQPVFSGFSSVSNMQSAQASFRSARHTLYAKEQDIMLDNIDKYLSCIVAKEKYEISKQSYVSNETQLRAMREKFRQGAATSTDVASAKAAFSRSEAKRAEALSQYEAAKASFERVIGLPAHDLQMPKMPEDIITELDILIETSNRRNLNVNAARDSIIVARAAARALKGRLAPQVDLVLKAQKDNYSKENNFNGNVNRKSVTTSLSVNIPILSRGGAEYSAIRQAKIQEKKAMISLDSTMKRINAACVAIISQYKSAKQSLAAQKEAVKASELAYKGMVAEEKLGSKTIIDVLVAEERLNSARENLSDARKNLLITGYQLKLLVGELTAHSMNLSVNYFMPEKEFSRVKYKIIGA